MPALRHNFFSFVIPPRLVGQLKYAMQNDLVITRSVLIHADPFRVWQIITSQHGSAHHGYNYEVQTDWQPGSPISWYDGLHEMQRKGYIMDFEPVRTLKFSKFDVHAGEADDPANYIHATYEVKPLAGKTELVITLSNFNGSDIRAEMAAQDLDLHVIPALQAISEGEIAASY
jgi:hypothetical protein